MKLFNICSSKIILENNDQANFLRFQIPKTDEIAVNTRDTL